MITHAVIVVDLDGYAGNFNGIAGHEVTSTGMRVTLRGPLAMAVQQQRLSDDQIEAFAIRCALGNNGGAWSTHYVDEQKEFWRQFVRDLASNITALHLPRS